MHAGRWWASRLWLRRWKADHPSGKYGRAAFARDARAPQSLPGPRAARAPRPRAAGRPLCVAVRVGLSKDSTSKVVYMVLLESSELLYDQRLQLIDNDLARERAGAPPYSARPAQPRPPSLLLGNEYEVPIWPTTLRPATQGGSIRFARALMAARKYATSHVKPPHMAPLGPPVAADPRTGSSLFSSSVSDMLSAPLLPAHAKAAADGLAGASRPGTSQGRLYSPSLPRAARSHLAGRSPDTPPVGVLAQTAGVELRSTRSSLLRGHDAPPLAPSCSWSWALLLATPPASFLLSSNTAV